MQFAISSYSFPPNEVQVIKVIFSTFYLTLYGANVCTTIVHDLKLGNYDKFSVECDLLPIIIGRL